MYFLQTLTYFTLRFYAFARRLIAKGQRKCHFYPRFWSNNGKYGPELHFRWKYFYSVVTRLLCLSVTLHYLSIYFYLTAFI